MCILKARRNNTVVIVSVGILLVALILVGGTLWMGSSASKGTDQAARNVSLLYLDELAGRRKQVVENSLQGKIDDICIAVDLMTQEDLSDSDHLRAYQAKMKRLFNLDKFAFVDTHGAVYTALEGRQTGMIDQYQFNYQTISEPEISMLNLDSSEKKAVIAVPIDPLSFEGETLTVCFMEIDMAEMLSGVSMETRTDGTTFCNIYTSDGVALTNVVLGGLAEEDNLLEALKSRAEFEDGSSYEQVKQDFTEGTRRAVSFSYNGIRETLSYVPITGTSWMLTYLIRESLISDQIRTISGDPPGKSSFVRCNRAGAGRGLCLHSLPASEKRPPAAGEGNRGHRKPHSSGRPGTASGAAGKAADPAEAGRGTVPDDRRPFLGLLERLLCRAGYR